MNNNGMRVQGLNITYKVSNDCKLHKNTFNDVISNPHKYI